MCQIHGGISSIVWGIGLDRVVRANSWATLFACLLLNSTWEFWNQSTKNCLQAEMIQPNSLLSSILELTQSTTLLQSSVKSTLSNCWLETQSKVVCNSTTSLPSISQRGENQSVFARTKTPTSSRRHMPKPTMLREVEKDASMLHLYLLGVGFFQYSSSCLVDRAWDVVDWALLQDLIAWAALGSSIRLVARWSTCELSSLCCCQSFMFRHFQRFRIIVAISLHCPDESCCKRVKIKACIF